MPVQKTDLGLCSVKDLSASPFTSVEVTEKTTLKYYIDVSCAFTVSSDVRKSASTFHLSKFPSLKIRKHVTGKTHTQIYHLDILK